MLREIGDEHVPDFTNQRICVIGGGNVAMDVARSSIRLGAKSVQIIYRRRQIDMTALPEEVEGAIADGCEIMELYAPGRIEKDADNNVTAFIAVPQIVGAIKWGRPTPVKAHQEEVRIPCDKVIVAIGQGIDSQSFGDFGIPIERGRLQAFDTSEVKNKAGIFAGGDCVTGPATVIRAIAAGKVAAANIDEYLGYEHEINSSVDIPRIRFDDHQPCGRVNMKERPASERIHDFKLMECGMSEEEALQESSRCLHCDHFGYGIFKGGREAKW